MAAPVVDAPDAPHASHAEDAAHAEAMVMASRWDTSNRRATLPPDWPAIRARILTRDGHACTLCGAVANQVDHIVRGAGDHDGNLTSLCAQHHAWKSSLEGAIAMRQTRTRTLRVVPKHPGLT